MPFWSVWRFCITSEYLTSNFAALVNFLMHSETDCACTTIAKLFEYRYFGPSGQWSFDVGLPAKSTVSGTIMIIVPDVMGVVMWSPLLDKSGNSVRGIAFSRMLTEIFSFHSFENPSPQLTSKSNPVRKTCHESKEVCFYWILLCPMYIQEFFIYQLQTVEF